MNRSRMLIKPVITLLALLAIWWLVPTFAKSFMRVSFFEMQAPFWTAASYIEDLQEYWAIRNHSKAELYEAGRDLARLNAAYQLRIQENEELKDEVARLERLLNLPSHPGYRSEVTRVVRRDLSGWWQQFIVRKGRNHGISKGNAVVYAGGVVGRVKKVYAYTAVVELITSRSFRVAAKLESDARPVTYQGSVSLPLQGPSGEILNVQPDIVVPPSEPRRIVTSSLGGVFPEGLTIGWTDQLSPSTDGLLQRGSVRLDERLIRLREVSVLVPFEESEDVQ